ncbi:klaroid protein isoform X1 [Plutella xylostella]|uniref:klaroid protein isoform X1 n=2 Tax=Plutella xylostella TaxID=51655 RepID=UPI0020324A42|nr:klaroid protein isoform X1 [Plutella xylostella]
MENTTVSGLRSRSRSKTPFLRSSCDRENCAEGGEHTHHKSGRKTPVKRSTPVKQLGPPSSTGKATPEPIIELDEEHVSPPAHRTRQSMRSATEKLIKTSDYSSEESPDRLKASQKEISQNQQNYKYEYERVTTSQRSYSGGSLADIALSPINTYNASRDRSRFGSPAYSACSTDSSFAEQALADASVMQDRDPQHSVEHLPYRLYKMAGEYWNKYPKTDYTYSPLSRDRVELAPGQIAVPNMSRRSLSQFRLQGPVTSPDEVDLLMKETAGLRKRYTSIDSSDDDTYGRVNGGYTPVPQRWWITTLVLSIITTLAETTTSLYRRVVPPPQPRYPYRGVEQRGVLSRAGSVLAAPFYWVYTVVETVVTTTVTTVTETVSPTKSRAAYQAASRREAKRRWWPWLLLLLLPVAGYGCYNFVDVDQISQYLPQQKTLPVSQDTYRPPQIVQDPNLAKRIAALEDWAVNADTKLKFFDQKLSKLDNLEAQIESYSLKHLQQNLITILNVNSENGEAIAAKFKDYFDKHYVNKEQMQLMSQEIHERLISSWKPDLDEDRIRQLVQEYLLVFERKQTELLVEKVKEYVKEVQVTKVDVGFDVEAVKRIVAGMLDVYDADKTGVVDYALESAGGQVISTKCTELYQIKTKQYSVLGLPVWWVYTSPRHALTPGAMPAECWAFQGFPGYLVVRTYAIIEVTGFSVEHMSRLLAVDGKIESAPKNFSVYGLRDEMDPEPHLFGQYQYDANGTAIQHFPVLHPKTQRIAGVDYPVAYDIIELRVESNYGNPTYTCVYRFRVHGNPLTDIKQATDDSMRDSET